MKNSPDFDQEQPQFNDLYIKEIYDEFAAETQAKRSWSRPINYCTAGAVGVYLDGTLEFGAPDKAIWRETRRDGRIQYWPASPGVLESLCLLLDLKEVPLPEKPPGVLIQVPENWRTYGEFLSDEGTQRFRDDVSLMFYFNSKGLFNNAYRQLDKVFTQLQKGAYA